LITESLGGTKAWLKDLFLLEGLLKFVDDEKFQNRWAAIKKQNKEKLAHYIETTIGVKVNTNSMFDIQVKVNPRFYISPLANYINIFLEAYPRVQGAQFTCISLPPSWA
jgi:CRISPR/Cas system CSM-associated protein Csm5 (group 7 of RAMP superfamily)